MWDFEIVRGNGAAPSELGVSPTSMEHKESTRVSSEIRPLMGVLTVDNTQSLKSQEECGAP